MVRAPSSETIEPVLERDPELALWWGAPIECASTLMDARRRERISLADFQQSRALIDHLRARAVEVQPTEAVRARALRILSVHELRAAAALELAAALIWCQEKTHGVGFVSLNEALRLAATLEGFRVLPYAGEVHEPEPEV